MGFNLRHPIFGTGLGTPAGQLDPTQAAEAAKHVRHAIEYLVPKDAIISSLLNGFGEPGLTPFVTRTMPGFNFDIAPRDGSDPNAKTLAMNELMAAGYTFVKSSTTQFLELIFSAPVIIVIVFSLLLLSVGVIRRRRRLNYALRGIGTQQRYETRSGRSETSAANKTIESNEIPLSDHKNVACPSCGKISRGANAQYCMYCGAHLGTSLGAPETRPSQVRAKTSKGTCIVCNLRIGKSEQIVQCPYCGNMAHRDHMMEWLHVKDYCPVCRHHIDTRDL
jgi:predicted RNA-binding Zn-ribbon protein involved in translation (DUF1610 family)